MQTDDAPRIDGPSRDDLYRALGRLVFEFGQLDQSLHDALYLATGGREETRILTAGLRFPELVARFEALYASFEPATTGERGVKNLCGVLRGLNDERNREMHSIWGFYATSGHPLRTQQRLKRGGMMLEIHSVTPSELQELATRMSEAADKVWEVALDYGRQCRTARIDSPFSAGEE